MDGHSVPEVTVEGQEGARHAAYSEDREGGRADRDMELRKREASGWLCASGSLVVTRASSRERTPEPARVRSCVFGGLLINSPPKAAPRGDT